MDVPSVFIWPIPDETFFDGPDLQLEKNFQRKGDIPYKFLSTKDAVIGFSARPNPDNPVMMRAYHQSNDMIVEWAKNHL